MTFLYITSLCTLVVLSVVAVSKAVGKFVHVYCIQPIYVSFELHLESGTIIPLYIYPVDNNSWQQLYDAYSAHPIPTWAIVNVNSGPGTSLDPNYVNAIRQLQSTGIETLGYVYTLYGNRSQTDVRTEMDRWKTFYNTTGIFFDEMAYVDDNTKVQYYQNLSNYAKEKGFTFTVGNPGTRTLSKYFATVDNIVIFEEDSGFPSQEKICSQDTNGKGRGSVSILSYNISSLDPSAITAVKDCAGFVYVTDDSGDNPWDTLPNYLTQLFGLLRG